MVCRWNSLVYNLQEVKLDHSSLNFWMSPLLLPGWNSRWVQQHTTVACIVAMFLVSCSKCEGAAFIDAVPRRIWMIKSKCGFFSSRFAPCPANSTLVKVNRSDFRVSQYQLGLESHPKTTGFQGPNFWLRKSCWRLMKAPHTYTPSAEHYFVILFCYFYSAEPRGGSNSHY